MSFDLLAPHYRWMEWLLAGRKLQRCRTAFLPGIPPPRYALLLGEGNGRFLVELLRHHPRVRVVCVDASARMLECTRSRLRAAELAHAPVEFFHADILEQLPPHKSFDLIVSHFFLDCLRPEQLAQLVPRIASACSEEARWLIADFCEPPGRAARWRARVILRMMYWFFRWVTGLPATNVTPPDPYLERHGFQLCERRRTEWGLLHTDLWRRGEQTVKGRGLHAASTHDSEQVPNLHTAHPLSRRTAGLRPRSNFAG
jgi:ubiquinone/menaquinone biosynthesis C-methylase UbiE